MYQVLYRKWRPKTFDDVCGQSSITRTLQNELTSNRISHAYLFTGSHGTGKTTCAKILAKAVNCLNPIDGNPCNECEMCKGIESSAITDVSEIDAASNNGVDDIRSMRDETAYTPASAKYRVFIIDEVHMLSQSAFNALLKTLEEPPAHVIFILATTEVHKIPATILSRCQRFDFRRIDAEHMIKRLEYIAQQEGKTITQDAATLIANLSDGALRDALSILDQCITISDDVDEKIVAKAAGLSPQEYIIGIIKAVKNRDISAIISILDDIYSSSKSFSRLCEELIEAFRAMMLIKTVKEPQSLLKMSSEQIARLSECSDLFDIAELIHIIKLLQNALDNMTYSSNKRIDMELCLIKASDPSVDSSFEALSRRLSELEGKIRSGVIIQADSQETVVQQQNAMPNTVISNTVQAENIYVPKVSSASVGAEQTSSEKITEDAQNRSSERSAAKTDTTETVPMTNWSDILQELNNMCMPLYAVLDDSVAYVCGNRVLIDAPNSLFRTLINQPGYKDHLKTAILNKTGRRFAIGPYKRTGESRAKKASKLDEIADRLKDSGVDVTIE